jgi:hypothetical protein
MDRISRIFFFVSAQAGKAYTEITEKGRRHRTLNIFSRCVRLFSVSSVYKERSLAEQILFYNPVNPEKNLSILSILLGCRPGIYGIYR